MNIEVQNCFSFFIFTESGANYVFLPHFRIRHVHKFSAFFSLFFLFEPHVTHEAFKDRQKVERLKFFQFLTQINDGIFYFLFFIEFLYSED